jgi:hypothetical protein
LRGVALFYDTGIAASGEGVIPDVLHGTASPVGPRVPPTSQEVDAEAAIVARAPSSLGDMHLWTNLRTLREHGGKLLFYNESITAAAAPRSISSTCCPRLSTGSRKAGTLGRDSHG